MVKILLVGRDEGLTVAPVETGLEEDVGVGARAQVQRRALGARGAYVPREPFSLLEVVGGVTLVVLLIALLDVDVELAAVGGVGAGVVLYIAGAAQGLVHTDKGVAVDGEGPVA